MKGANLVTLKSSAGATGNSAETTHSLCTGRKSAQLWGNFFLYCKEPHKTGDKKICREYTIEATIENKMRLDKGNTRV